MSRSNPIEGSPNPATVWLEWKGENGELTYWDKQAEKRMTLKLPFTFMLLDRLGTVRGYSKNMESGIYANEVRDTRMQPLVVKYFKGGTVATGLWDAIKPVVKTAGGKFCSTCYIAVKGDKPGELVVAGAQWSGCSLGPWFEFEKKHRKKVEVDGKKVAEMYAKAIRVKRGAQQKVGKTLFFPPEFEIADVTPESNAAAVALDTEVQEYLTDYFARSSVERADPQSAAERPQADARDDGEPDVQHPEPEAEPEPGDDVPF